MEAEEELLKKAREVLEGYKFGSEGEEEFNNDDVQIICREIDKFFRTKRKTKNAK